MKICILGSSPIQCLYAFELSKNHEVCVLEKSPFTGGAWQSRPFTDISMPIFNNIIYPFSSCEESLLPNIFQCLNQYGVSPKFINSDSYHSIVDFKPKNCLIADFSPMFDALKDHTSLSFQCVGAVPFNLISAFTRFLRCVKVAGTQSSSE